MSTTSKTAMVIILAACSIQAAEYHISPKGLDSNTGSKSKPFKTISAAAHIAQPGDVITVHKGVYRERVNPPRGGTSDEKRIVYQAAPGEKAVIKGSEVVTGWEKVQNDTWKVVLPNSFFGDFNPYSDVIGGEWYLTPRKHRFDHLTGMVYLNGEWIDEAKTLEQVLAPTGERLCWKAKVEDNTTTIWAQFKGVDPNKELVEINVRQSVFYPDQPGMNYITVRGFTMRQAATPWSGAMSEQIGLIGTHWSKGWIIEDNVISHSMNTGITLGRYDLPKRGVAMPEVSAPGFVKSCELALEHGWSKEHIGSHVVRNNHISHCEKNGIHGSLGGIFSTIEGNTICDITVQGWIDGHDTGGLKLLGSHDVIIRNNHIYRTHGRAGIWIDWMAQGARVTGNLLHDNRKWDLFVEVNHGPFLVDNNIFLSKVNLLEASGGGAYAHNLFTGIIKLREELERETPYHKPHSTKILGMSKVIGDDERFYNNLFTGKDGLSGYNKWKPDHLQAVGNVYLAGTKPSLKDQGELIDKGFKPGVKLSRKDDGWWLEMAINPAWELKSKREIVTTETLGNAKIPDAPFENPDGTPYRLDADYFGKKRNTENPAPGPFAAQSGKKIQIKVWPDN
ncbi:MAG: DUF1565 domain-containing protein [Verrucomicrobia bacterium]|nr:DUF1565 domain-containing protein [Verrucomicrobiota bacterium]